MSKIPFDFWSGYTCLKEFATEEEHHIHLTHRNDTESFCGVCKKPVSRVHDIRFRKIRDSDIFGKRCLLIVPVRRVKCPDCGIRQEFIPWLYKNRRFTIRFESSVASLLSFQISIAHTAEYFGLHWNTVKEIDQRRMQKLLELNPLDKSKLRYLMIDEFAIEKGHKYATVVADAISARVIWVGKGNSRDSVRPFFKGFLRDACKNIKAVAMDMNAAFDLEVRENCLKAEVVYDLFHVVARFGREVIDRVRVDIANQLKHDKPARKLVKSSKWLLLKNQDNLTDKQAGHLDEVLKTNLPITIVYMAKDLVKAIWKANTVKQAQDAWNTLMQCAKESGIHALKRFCANLTRYKRGIIAHAIFPMGTSRLEGMNNKIKVIKRIAFGFRDFAYFSLKLRTAFHPNV